MTVTVTTTVPARPTVAPPVTKTLDIAPYRTRPCDLLTRDQQVALGLPPESAKTQIDCEWKVATPSRTVLVTPFVDEDFFNQAYRQSNDYGYVGSRDRKWEIFEPVAVGGQPAIVASTSSDRFNCGVILATGPVSSIWVVVIDGDRRADSCPGAVAIAERVVGNLGG